MKRMVDLAGASLLVFGISMAFIAVLVRLTLRSSGAPMGAPTAIWVCQYSMDRQIEQIGNEVRL